MTPTPDRQDTEMRPFAIGLDHSTIPMPKGAEDEARNFYAGILGFPEVPKPPTLIVNGGVWYQFDDGRQLHLQVEEPFAPMANPHPAFRVERIEEFAQTVEAGGYQVEWDERMLPRRRFYTFDPFGNRLEMIEPSP